jgi:hypothetical protein
VGCLDRIWCVGPGRSRRRTGERLAEREQSRGGGRFHCHPSLRDPGSEHGLPAQYRIYLWFLGVLRGFVLRAEGGTGTLGTVAFGAGCVWAGISMAAQAFQIGVAIAPTPAGGRVGGAGDEYLPVAQAALVAAVAPATMRGWIRDGRLRRYHAGRELRILRSDLERLLRADPRPSSAVITPEDAAALIERRRRRRPHAGRRS